MLRMTDETYQATLPTVAAGQAAVVLDFGRSRHASRRFRSTSRSRSSSSLGWPSRRSSAGRARARTRDRRPAL